MATIAELMVKIGADTSGLQNGLGDAEKKSGSLLTSILKIGSAMGVGLLIKNAFMDGYEGIVAMEDQVTQLNAVLKSTNGAVGMTADELSNMATQLQLTTKFAEEDTLAAENLLLTFTNIGGEVFPQATMALLDMATAMGTDAKGSAIQLGKALNDPTEGISALSRVGVTFTEEQKNVIKSLQDMGDMAGAQTVILDELKKEFGGSAEAAGTTFAGKLAIAKNALGEIKESIVMQFMPSLMSILTWVQAHMPDIQSFFDKAFTAIGVVIDSAKQAFGWFVDGFKQNDPSKTAGVWEGAMRTLGDVVRIAKDAFNGGKEALGGLIEMMGGNNPNNVVGGWSKAFDILGGVLQASFLPAKLLLEALTALFELINGKSRIDGTSSGILGGSAQGHSSSGILGGTTQYESAYGRMGGAIQGYATGTNYVPNDMLAYVHKGEAIIPASRNGQGTANIYVQLDGYTIAQAIAQPLKDMITVKTGLRI